jgi:hypothetical protein
LSFVQDLTLWVLLGVACVSLGFALGLGVRNLAIPRLKAYFFDLINSYVAAFLQNLTEHPEQAEALIKPFIAAAMKELQVATSGPGSKSKSLNLFGIKIPGEIANLLIERFAGQILGGKGAKSQSQNNVDLSRFGIDTG